MGKLLSLFIMLIFLFPNLSFSQKNTLGFIVKGGYDFTWKHKASLKSTNATDDIGDALSFGAEIYKYSDTIEVGVGVEKQLARGSDSFGGDFSFVPIYSSLRFFLGNSHNGNICTYISARFGWNLISASEEYDSGFDCNGGIFYGGGFGFLLNKNVFIEGIYSANNGSIDLIDTNTIDISYSKIGIYLGGRF